MKSDLISDISKDALRILGNAGLLYRGNPINYNMGINYHLEINMFNVNGMKAILEYKIIVVSDYYDDQDKEVNKSMPI